MCLQKGVNWNIDITNKLKRGRLIINEIYEKESVMRKKWISTESPIFTQDRELLKNLIPSQNQ